MSELLKSNDDCSLSVIFKTFIFLSLKCFLSDFFFFLPLISVLLLKRKLKFTVLLCKLQAMDTFRFSLSGGIWTQVFLLFLLVKWIGLHFPDISPYPACPALAAPWVALTNTLSGELGSGPLFSIKLIFQWWEIHLGNFFPFPFFFLNPYKVLRTGLLLFLKKKKRNSKIKLYFSLCKFGHQCSWNL